MDRTSQAEETVRRYSDMVYRLAFARTGNTADAEDVYQEVFLRYLRSDPQFTSEEHRKAWLLRVTINCAKKLHAAPWRRRTEPLSETLEAPSPEGEALWEELRRLPDKYRTVLHLYYYEDMTPAAGPEPGHGAVPADAGQRQAAGAAGGGIAWIEENTSR